MDFNHRPLPCVHIGSALSLSYSPVIDLKLNSHYEAGLEPARAAMAALPTELHVSHFVNPGKDQISMEIAIRFLGCRPRAYHLFSFK